ncbi:MAG: hemerythrin domain-containing protein [Pseudomonadota bacterium]
MIIPPTDLLLREFARRPVPPPPEPAARPVATLEVDGLIEHIIARYHEVHRRELPEAVRLARKVEAVHGAAQGAPVGLADHLALIAADLEEHQQKEEQVLFPMMLMGGAPMIRFPIGRMMAEHEEVREQLARLSELAGRFVPPEGACGSWRELCRLCGKIHDDLIEHMRLENEVLFPRFLD